MATASSRPRTTSRICSTSPAQLRITGVDGVPDGLPPDVAAAVQLILDRAAHRSLADRQENADRSLASDGPLVLFRLPSAG